MSPQHFLQQMQQSQIPGNAGNKMVSPPNQNLNNSPLLLQQTSTNSNGNSNSNSNKYPIAQPIAARVVPIAPSAFVPTQPAHPSQFTQNAMFQQPTQGSGVPSQSQSQPGSSQNQNIQSIYQQPPHSQAPSQAKPQPQTQKQSQEPKVKAPPKAPRRSTGTGMNKSISNAALNKQIKAEKAREAAEKTRDLNANATKAANTKPPPTANSNSNGNISTNNISARAPSRPQLPIKPLIPTVAMVPVNSRIQSILDTTWQNAGRARTRRPYVLDSASQIMLSNYFEELSK